MTNDNIEMRTTDTCNAVKLVLRINRPNQSMFGTACLMR